MENDIYNLVYSSIEYVYEEKHKRWIKFIVQSIINHDYEAQITVRAIKMLNEGVEYYEVLDYIYLSRLDVSSILNIINSIFVYYIDGPKFMRNIYKDYMTIDLEESIKKVEDENKIYQKKKNN